MDKRTIIAFVLIGMIIVLYGEYARWISPPPPEPIETIAATDTTKPQPAAEHTVPALLAPAASGATVLPPTTAIAGLVNPPAAPERFVTVETERFIARLSSHGAQLVSLKLKPNDRYLKQEIELLHQDRRGAHPSYRFWMVNGPIETADLAFELAGWDESRDLELNVKGSETRQLIFTAPLDSVRRISIIYSFSGNRYTLTSEVKGEGLASLWVRDYAEVHWSGGVAFTETDSAQDHYYSMAYAFYQGDVLEELKLSPKKAQVIGPTTGETRWVALRTKYFLTALIPDLTPASGAWMENRLDSSYVGNNSPNLLGVGMKLPLKEGVPATPIRLFIGPLDDDVIAAVDPSLKGTMNWGWKIIAPFSKFVLWGLKAMHGAIPNYGICIILFSILVKVLVWPLTRSSYRSMAAMARVQPLLQELRAKYKGDPQRLNKETMKLYKEQKINPMGGCLPVLLQMPLLYALFIVFRSTIEFRQAPFIWWIKDLSAPDIITMLPFTIPMYGSHIALLPILMGISTYFQSKSTMTDPNQKMMLYFMPVFMTVIFNNFPSGLNLYYTLFNVWTLLQQKMTPPPKAAMTQEVT